MRPAATPERIVRLEPNQIFVFGSNYAGRHGKGAALTAVRKFGARHGQGMGLQGRSYGIATKDRCLRVLPLTAIAVQVDRFLRYAAAHPELDFLVTKFGCGLAHFSAPEIAGLFRGRNVPANVVLPLEFQQHLAGERA